MTDRLLVVDDEAPIRYALRDYFRASGYEVDCAATVAEAIKALDEISYVAVIADLRFGDPEKSQGLDVVRRARERSACSPIIVLTAYGSPEVAAEALRSGADVLLYKPVPLPELARLVLERRETRMHGGDTR